MQESKPLLIIGASARAATESATRAGFAVIAADLFNDRDLDAISNSCEITNYPEDFKKIRDRFPHAPLIYTGAIENYPDLLEELECRGALLGNNSPAVRASRDPMAVSRLFRQQGINFPSTSLQPPVTQNSGDWLVKPYHSAGGNSISSWNTGDEVPTDKRYIFQNRVDGLPCSAAFVADKQDVYLLGMSKMLVGTDWGATAEFSYCGSVAIPGSQALEEQWLQIGRVASHAFKLRGVFGIDAIETNEELVPLEINPRYTASMEVIETSLNHSIVAMHVDACLRDQIEPPLRKTWQPMAKLIVYATRPSVFPRHPPTFPDIRCADIPHADTLIQPGHPILTLLGKKLCHLRDAAIQIQSTLPCA